MGIGLVAFIVLIVVISLSFGALFVKWDNDLKREKLRAEGGGSSLGASELRNLIQEAMLDANAPLEERLDLIEAHMRRLPGPDTESKRVEVTRPDEPTED